LIIVRVIEEIKNLAAFI